MFENIFETVNAGLAQSLYEDFLRDPASVPQEWRDLFTNGLKGEPPETPPSRTEKATATEKTSHREVPGELIKGPALRLLKNMEASLTIPTATSFRDLDVTALWERRADINQTLKTQGLKLSFTHLIGWAIVQAAKDQPSMTHAVLQGDDGPHRYDPEGVHLGLAVDVERRDGSRGLMVPVIKQANTMTFRDFYEEYERLVEGARTSKLLPDAYQGSTITLTNPGTIGTVASVPRLMEGQGTIVATGAIRTIAGVRVMTITSTYDHRIIQGAESGLFLKRIDALLGAESTMFDDVASAFEVTTKRRTTPSAAPETSRASVTPDMLYHVAAAMNLVRSHRTHGFLAAQLDPLGVAPVGDPELDPHTSGLTPDIMASIPADILRTYVPGATLADVLPNLKATYCGTIAYEIEHIAPNEERIWLRKTIESGDHRVALQPEDRRKLAEVLVKVDGLESFLHKAYLGHKRFGIEGLDVLVPMLHLAVEMAADQGATDAVIGMAHRGRLNVLSHVVGLPYETLLAEFEGGREVEETLTPEGGTGDVKYHHGAEGIWKTPAGKQVRINLMPNPSHLEAVNPVVEGFARGVQTQRDGGRSVVQPETCLPILIHGDAAFAGQGVVAETFNLANLEGYSTGGTLHIITNNQVGFTTPPNESRSTVFASDLAKGFDVPIVHVNADDPEACLAAVRLAMMYRLRYGEDCVIDLVGYRRHGHNEGDEPRYTQPLMYQRIDAHPTVRQLYGDFLVGRGVVTSEQIEDLVAKQQRSLVDIQQRLRDDVAAGDPGAEPSRTGSFTAITDPETKVPRPVLDRLVHECLRYPESFTPNPKLKKQLNRRTLVLSEDASLDWAHAEALALASLLLEGHPLRLTGQDSERGTFSQRQLVLHDAKTGAQFTPIQNLRDAKASFELHNSPLSEYAALGFEYGYSVQAPEAMVIWEAQFGDFVNGAEIIIDQFVTAGLAKWGQTSRLVMLLPHGYEGQGPEHSSARLERFLAIGAEGNIRVANCSTPAQYFHMLRRQAKHVERRPLVMMTPKSLLRLPQASSTLDELVNGEFQPVLDDPQDTTASEDVRRLVFCSGKIYYDIITHSSYADAKGIAVARIELMYPFPKEAVRTVLKRYPNVQEVMWVQEEPSNFGARKWMLPQIGQLLGDGATLRTVSRPERSSPAEGYPAAHKAEQERIVTEALR